MKIRSKIIVGILIFIIIAFSGYAGFVYYSVCKIGDMLSAGIKSNQERPPFWIAKALSTNSDFKDSNFIPTMTPIKIQAFNKETGQFIGSYSDTLFSLITNDHKFEQLSQKGYIDSVYFTFLGDSITSYSGTGNRLEKKWSIELLSLEEKTKVE